MPGYLSLLADSLFFPPILLDDKIITSIQLSLMVTKSLCNVIDSSGAPHFLLYTICFFEINFQSPPPPLLARMVNFHIFHIKTFLIDKRWSKTSTKIPKSTKPCFQSKLLKFQKAFRIWMKKRKTKTKNNLNQTDAVYTKTCFWSHIYTFK